MMRVTATMLVSIALLLAGCSRHFVVERDAGRVDSERSIATNSDEQWTIRSEPLFGEEEGR